MEISTKKANKFCISVDGSQYSDWGFDLVFNELYQPGDYVIVVHISKVDQTDIPFQYQADTIMSKYDTKLLVKLPNSLYSLFRERREHNVHALQQVDKLATKSGATLLVTGYQGHKTGKNKNEFTKGITYLISNVKIPTLVVKENSKRSEKKNGEFTWVVALEETSGRSFKAFEFASNYMNKAVDKIYGMHIKNLKTDPNELKEAFVEFCKAQGIVNYEFILFDEERNTPIGKRISTIINYEEKFYTDFLVLGHNPNKYSNINDLPIVEVFRSVDANILFFS